MKKESRLTRPRSRSGRSRGETEGEGLKKEWVVPVKPEIDPETLVIRRYVRLEDRGRCGGRVG